MLTSLADSTPTSMLEAMVCGLPIVCSNVGVVKLILGDYNCVVELDNQHQFTDCLYKLSVSIELRRDILEKNMMESKEYAWKNVAKKINNYFV